MDSSQHTIVQAAECDGGLHIVEICDGEDCCAAARRAGGICQHGANGNRSVGEGATFAECEEALKAD